MCVCVGGGLSILHKGDSIYFFWVVRKNKDDEEVKGKQVTTQLGLVYSLLVDRFT